ncbi:MULTISPECIES: hypothetical protein [unclassified Streptomyces]
MNGRKNHLVSDIEEHARGIRIRYGRAVRAEPVACPQEMIPCAR